MKVVIPAYVWPGDAMLTGAAAASPAPAYVIMNQNSGDTLMAGSWLTQADTLRRAGIKVLAYVYTNSATRSLSDVELSINKQLVTADGKLHFDGIFFDLTTRDVGTANANLTYYTTLYSYVRSTAESVTPGAGADMIVAHNPGTAVDDRFVTAPVADLFCTFEGSEADYNASWLGGNVFSLPSGVYRNGTDLGTTKFLHLVHTVTDGSPGMNAVTKTAARRNAGLVYATDDVLANPWDVTPSWGFSAETAYAAGQGPVSYSPQLWVDGSAGGTPLSAGRLNHVENGVGDVADRLSTVQSQSTSTALWSTFRGRSSTLIRGMSAANLTAMATAPTLSYNAGGATPATSPTQIVGSAYIGPTDARLHYYSGTPITPGTVYGLSPSVWGPASTPALEASLGVGYMGFDFDGQVFELGVFGSNQQQFRLWVDGIPHSVSPVSVTPSDFSNYMLKIDFGSRAYRRIVVEGAGNAFTNWYWGGLRALPTDTVTAPSVGATSPSLIVFGDDVTVGVTGANAAQGWAPLLGQMLGWGNTSTKGIGGTGFIATASGAQLAYGDRAVHELYGSGADSIVVQGSFNDDGSAGLSALDTAIGNLLDGLSSNTSAQVFLTSILRKPTTNDTTVNAQLSAAATSRGIPYIDVSGLITGTGNVSATAGDGNADFYMQSTGQLTQGGHYAVAAHVARSVASYLGVTLS